MIAVLAEDPATESVNVVATAVNPGLAGVTREIRGARRAETFVVDIASADGEESLT